MSDGGFCHYCKRRECACPKKWIVAKSAPPEAWDCDWTVCGPYEFRSEAVEVQKSWGGEVRMLLDIQANTVPQIMVTD